MNAPRFTAYKYPRTPHAPWSRPAEDDKVLRSMEHFIGREVVVTEKLDGENTTLYPEHIHARSIDSRDHPSRAWVKQFWGSIKHEIPHGWRVCGESMYAKHSIAYDNLESYFYGFSVWDESNVALSWDETLVYFNLLGITPVPTLYRGVYDESLIKALYDESMRGQREGYVIRMTTAIPFEAFGKSFAKFVRKGHVQTSEHWMHSEIVPNKLKGA